MANKHSDNASQDQGPTQEEIEQLGQRARFGVIALALRSIFQNILVLVANVYLARVLSPADYGIFAILQFAVQVLKQVGDAGLAAALIQNKQQPHEKDLHSIWWFQLGLGLFLVALAFAAAPFLPEFWPELPSGVKWLFPALTLSLLFTMLRAIPFLLLERHVRFGMIGTLEFSGSVFYYGTSVVLATLGYGSTALVLATVVQALVISVLANIVQPWRPRLFFEWQRVKRILGFGLAFQGTNAVNFLNGALAPLLVGSRLGPAALGIVQFAQNTAWFPTLFVGIVRRVSFPFLSRLQHDEKLFAQEFEKAVVACAIPIFFFLGLFLGSAEDIVRIIYSEKWLPAVPALYVYSVGISLNFFSWIGSAALEALGQPKRLLKIVTVSTGINWAACMVAVLIAPTPLGFALGFSCHMIFGTTGIFLALRKLTPHSKPIRRIVALLPAALVMSLVGRQLHEWTDSVTGLISWVLCGAVIFLITASALDPRIRKFLLLWLNKRWSKFKKKPIV